MRIVASAWSDEGNITCPGILDARVMVKVAKVPPSGVIPRSIIGPVQCRQNHQLLSLETPVSAHEIRLLMVHGLSVYGCITNILLNSIDPLLGSVALAWSCIAFVILGCIMIRQQLARPQ